MTEKNTSRGSEDVAHYQFARSFAARNDEHVVVFANGHRYDRAERRKAVRQLIAMCRRERDSREPDTAQACNG